MKVLSVGKDAKTIKGNGKGYLTGILYLAPHNSAGIVDAKGRKISVCRSASQACIDACLYESGHAIRFKNINEARINKTRRLFNDTQNFIKDLWSDMAKLIRQANKEGLTPCVRLNGTSDLDWTQYKYNGQTIYEAFPEIQFYDYLKEKTRLVNRPANLHYTFSFSGTNAKLSSIALAQGINVAVVVRSEALKKTMLHDSRFIDGDVDDLRFLDAKGKIVLLKAKAKAKDDMTGWVIDDMTQLNKITQGVA